MSTNPIPSKAVRFPTEEIAEIVTFGKNNTHSAMMRNISKTGAYFEMATNESVFFPGDIVQIKVILTKFNNKEHILNGEVVWEKNGLVGVQFIPSDKVFEKLKGR